MAASANMAALDRPATPLPVVRFIVLCAVSLCQRLPHPAYFSPMAQQRLTPISPLALSSYSITGDPLALVV